MTRRVGLFVTCLVNTMRPRVGFAALKLLEEAGFTVEIPKDQTCCGQPNYNAGDREAAKDFALRFADLFAPYDYVVVPSGSCAATIRHHHPKLFDESDPRRKDVATVASRTYELVSFLTDVADLTSVDAAHNGAVTYHDSCSGLRELGIKGQPRRLLGSVRGLEMKEMEDSEVCCGFGGLFCVKYPDISSEMVRKKTDAITASEADAVVLGDVGCLLNIEGALSRRGGNVKAYHVAEVLAGMTDAGPADTGTDGK